MEVRYYLLKDLLKTVIETEYPIMGSVISIDGVYYKVIDLIQIEDNIMKVILERYVANMLKDFRNMLKDK